MATLSNSTSVRLPNDVMGILKSQAKEEEARSDMDLEELDVDHFKDFVASL